ncbi:MAG: GNAT family N-acetyltransferase [Cyclobacteriaceae bacterium]|nr:GNAT family N-acetyltransferase [Cyclobacteriaceae bacterium HetDA_MAG_MS6]
MKYSALQKNSFRQGNYHIDPISEIDMEPIRKWRNAQIEVLRQPSEITQEEQSRYFNRVVMPLFDQEKPNQLLFSFFKQDALIGYGGVVHLSWIDRRAEMSFLVDDARASDQSTYQQDFTHFITLIKQLCFEEMNFNKLFTETYDFRTFHISILEEAGFVLEGRMRKHIKMAETFRDSLLHSVLKEEYLGK